VGRPSGRSERSQPARGRCCRSRRGYSRTSTAPGRDGRIPLAKTFDTLTPERRSSGNSRFSVIVVLSADVAKPILVQGQPNCRHPWQRLKSPDQQ
jgi:hypothetical protein